MKKNINSKIFKDCKKGLSAHSGVLPRLTLFVATILAFLLFIPEIMTQSVGASSDADFATCTDGDNTVYASFQELMSSVSASVEGGTTEQTCVIRATGEGDVVISLSSTVEISGNISINALVKEESQRVVFTRTDGFTGPLFHITDESSLNFIQSATDIGYADPLGPEIGTYNAEFVLDGGSNTDNNALLTINGYYTQSYIVSIENSTHFYTILGEGSVQYEDSTKVLFLSDGSDAYTDLQTAINEAESTLNFVGYTYDTEMNYTGIATYEMSEGVTVPDGKELWISALVGSGNDLFYLKAADDFVGEALFTIEEGASVAFDERQRADDGSFTVGNDQLSQFYIIMDFDDSATDYVPGGSAGPIWCDVRGSLLLGRVIFSEGVSAVFQEAGATYIIAMNSDGENTYTEYITYTGGGIVCYHEIVFDCGYPELTSPATVIKKTDEEITLSDYTGQKSGRTFNGWTTVQGSSIEMYDVSQPYTITDAVTLYGAWGLGAFTVSVESSAINHVYDKESVTLAVTAEHPLSGTYSLTYKWYKDETLIAGATENSHNVQYVADSGSYYCVVSITDGVYNETARIEDITVSITPAEIEIPDGDSATYTYSGSSQTYQIPESSDYSISGVTGQNAGNYTAVLSLTDKSNTVWKTVNTTTDQTIAWTIGKLQIAKPLVADTSFTYSGSEITLALAENTRYTIAGNKATNVGSYNATVTLADTANCEWSDSTTTVLSIAWTINKLQITKPAASVTTFTYSGSEITLALAESARYTIAGNTATNVGSYNATVTLADTANCEWSDSTTTALSIAWTINKLQITKPAASVTTFTYSGSEITLALAESAHYTIAGNKATNVGSYNATVTLADTANCEWSDSTTTALSIAWTINKLQITKPTASVTTFTYSGSEITLALAESAHYTIAGNKATNVGSYNATVTLADLSNTEWNDSTVAPLSFSWNIELRKVTKPTINIASLIYNGSEQSVAIADSAFYTITGNTATNAGSYTLLVTLADADNTVWSDGSKAPISAAWEIEKKTVVITADNKSVVYKQADVELTWSADGFVGNFSPAVIISRSSGDVVGVYPITVTLPDGYYGTENYSITFVGGSYTITRAVYDMTGVTLSDATYAYDGKEHSLTLAGTLPDGVSVKIEGNSGIELGSYSVTAVFSGDSINYEPIAPLSAILTIIESYDAEHLNDILNRWSEIDSSWLSAQAKVLFDKLIEDYKTQLYTAVDDNDLTAIDEEFNKALDSFAVKLESADSTAGILNRVFYAGDKIDGFCLRTCFFTGKNALVLNSYTVIYNSGDCLQEDDRYFKVSYNGITEVISILPVLPYRSDEMIFNVENTEQTYTYGDALPILSVSVSMNGQPLSGRAYWHPDTVSDGLIAGVNNYRYCFVPNGSDKVYDNYCTLTVNKATPVVSNVKATDTALTYGDAYPELTGISDYPGSFSFNKRHDLMAGIHLYTYVFTPDDSENVLSVSGTITLSVERAKLTVQLSDVVIYEGSTPIFPISYWGLVNGESSLSLINRATVVDVPTEVGVYTLTPSGVASDNYDITYRSGTMTILKNQYRAVITDNDDEGTATFDLGDGMTLSVRNRRNEITDTLQQRFSSYTATVPGLLTFDRIIGMYDLNVSSEDGASFSGARILQLQIPEDFRSGYAVCVIDCSNGEFSFITDSTRTDDILSFLTEHNGTFALCAVKQSDIADALNAMLTDNGESSDLTSLVLHVKTLYDRLDNDGKALLTGQTKESISGLLGTSTNKLKLETVNKNGTIVNGLGTVALPELNATTTDHIMLALEQMSTKPSDGGNNLASSLDKSIIASLSMMIDKTVYQIIDGKPVPLCETVDNSDIREALQICIPLTGDMMMYENYLVYLENEDGSMIEIPATIETINDAQYIVYKTDKCGTHLILGNQIALSDNFKAQSAFIAVLVIVASFGVVMLVRNLVLQCIKNRRA